MVRVTDVEPYIQGGRELGGERDRHPDQRASTPGLVVTKKPARTLAGSG